MRGYSLEALQQSAMEVSAAIAALTLPHPIRVGIDGFCAAGKTTFAHELATVLINQGFPIVRASTDDFQNPPEIRWQLGKRSAEGFYRHAIDFEALCQYLLLPLGPDGSWCYRTTAYDIRRLKSNLSEEFKAKANTILILDGLFLHVPELRQMLDFTVFVSADFEECIARAKLRNQEQQANAEAVEQLYRDRYCPGFQIYKNEVQPEKRAIVVIQN
jgi:uridine kinase